MTTADAVTPAQSVADAAEIASFYRNRDEIVGYPAYSGGPDTK